uniref:E3 ubiquitin-protein ligase parkin n=1 Tax=Panagrellus redivivus TaxID=6233 RepID=A0A7E4W5Z9_PANRE
MASSPEIQLLIVSQGKRRPLTIGLDDEETVKSLIGKVSEAVGSPEDALNIVFSGRRLSPDLAIDTLLLGKTTNLVVIVKQIEKELPLSVPSPPSTLATEDGKEEANGSYFVYCKGCTQVRQGKMRIYCGECKSTAVLIKEEPQSWADIYGAKELAGSCQVCEADVRPTVAFKCVVCEELAPALIHIKRNRYKRDCVICGDVNPLTFTLNCQHSACIECFEAYMDNDLNNGMLIRKPSVGFTVSCPMFNCNAFVQDPHHFYLLGIDKYRQFQRLATEKYLNLQDERQYCPYPNCGAAFMVDMFENEDKVSCPECFRMYCIHCKNYEACTCNHEGDENTTLIKSITKPCPTCNVATERNGGCSHITCTQCRAEWCFICSKDWSADCQWDHWFD